MTDAGPLPAHWFQILLALADRELHGLAITKEVLERTDGRMNLWPGMLYGALRKMADGGLVVETTAPADFVAAAGGRGSIASHRSAGANRPQKRSAWRAM